MDSKVSQEEPVLVTLLSTPCNGFYTWVAEVAFKVAEKDLSTPCNGFFAGSGVLAVEASLTGLSTPCNGFDRVDSLALVLRATSFQLHVMDSTRWIKGSSQ